MNFRWAIGVCAAGWIGCAAGMARYDVVVVGAGSAGVPAGVAAASQGAKTLVLERNTVCGGTTVAAAVNFPSLFHIWGEQRIAGVGWNISTNALFMGGGKLPDFKRPCGDRQWEHGFHVNTFLFAALCEEALVKSGAELLYRASPTALRKTADGWEMDVAASGESFTVACRQLVDCTGNGTIAAMAGARRERETANPQPATFMWRFEPNVDPARFDEAKLQAAFDAAVASGELRKTDSVGAFGPVRIADFVRGCGGNVNYVVEADNSTAAAATRTDMEGRAMMLRMYRFLRRQPGLENLRLTSVPNEVGIRETYRVVGERVVTGEAYLSGRVEDDSICYACYPVDMHDLRGGLKRSFPPEGVVPTVPFGALVPAGVPNLLVAGRCISSDRVANSALRVQATCMATGEAAGVAAALAAKAGVTPGALKVADVRKALRARGCIVPGL